jgi:hypothetical protein
MPNEQKVTHKLRAILSADVEGCDSIKSKLNLGYASLGQYTFLTKIFQIRSTV